MVFLDAILRWSVLTSEACFGRLPCWHARHLLALLGSMPCCHRVVFGCPRFALVPRRTARGPPASTPAVGHPALWPCRTPISPAPHLPQGGDRHRRQQCPRILARRCDGSIADAAERKKPKKGGGRELATRERSDDVRRLPIAPAQIRALLPRPVPPRTSTPRSPCTPGRRPSSLPPAPSQFM